MSGRSTHSKYGSGLNKSGFSEKKDSHKRFKIEFSVPEQYNGYDLSSPISVHVKMMTPRVLKIGRDKGWIRPSGDEPVGLPGGEGPSVV